MWLCPGTRQLAAPSSGSWAKAKVVAHHQAERWSGTGQKRVPVEQRSEPRSRGIVGFEVLGELAGSGDDVGGRRCFRRAQRRSANVPVLCREAELQLSVGGDDAYSHPKSSQVRPGSSQFGSCPSVRPCSSSSFDFTSLPRPGHDQKRQCPGQWGLVAEWAMRHR